MTAPRLAPLVLTGLLLAGCAAGSTGATGPSGPSAPGYSGPAVITDSASPTDNSSIDPRDLVRPSSPMSGATPATPGSPTSTPSGSATAAGLDACALPVTTVTARLHGAGMSHAGYLITFTNTGQLPCQLTGYPGVAVLDAKGRQVRQAARTPSGYLGGVRDASGMHGGKPLPVVLHAGEVGSALLEGEDVGTDGKGCPTESGLLVTPPNTRKSARIALRVVICGGVQVHPVVAGGSGSSG